MYAGQVYGLGRALGRAPRAGPKCHASLDGSRVTTRRPPEKLFPSIQNTQLCHVVRDCGV